MAAKPLPCPTLLRLLLDYNSETGTMTWKPRKPWMFTSTENRPAARICKIWNAKHAFTEAGALDGFGYTKVCVNSRRIKRHRAAWAIYYGEWPKGEIDHINQTRGDDKIVNLRDVPRTSNLRNKTRYSNNTSGRVGVYWVKRSGRWMASIPIDGKNKSLGSFDDFGSACAAREAAEAIYGYHINHGR